MMCSLTTHRSNSKIRNHLNEMTLGKEFFIHLVLKILDFSMMTSSFVHATDCWASRSPEKRLFWWINQQVGIVSEYSKKWEPNLIFNLFGFEYSTLYATNTLFSPKYTCERARGSSRHMDTAQIIDKVTIQIMNKGQFSAILMRLFKGNLFFNPTFTTKSLRSGSWT